MKRELLIAALLPAFLTCACSPWTPRERTIIEKSDSLMYVTVLPADSAILRSHSTEVDASQFGTPELGRLMDLMLHTVTHPSQDGVGIAAPQVGINRRLVWVQRFDKPGEPFECYANLQIDSLLGEVTHGPEGCLSVPPMRGLVPRWSCVIVSYADPLSGEQLTERVEGYTAIIFQHECDHLDGTLYIDKADTVFISPEWQDERQAFTYARPSWWKF